MHSVAKPCAQEVLLPLDGICGRNPSLPEEFPCEFPAKCSPYKEEQV